MKSFLLAVALSLISPFAFAEAGAIKIKKLDNGMQLRFEEIAPSRLWPNTFAQQAADSIPKAQIATSRISGHLSDQPGLEYSPVSYRTASASKEIRTEGMLVTPQAAWKFSNISSEQELPMGLILLMEALISPTLNGA